MAIQKNVTMVYVCDCCGGEFSEWHRCDSQVATGDIVLRVPASVIVDGEFVVCTVCAKAVAAAHEQLKTEEIAWMWEERKGGRRD